MTDIEITQSEITLPILIPEIELVEKLVQNNPTEKVSYKINGVVSVKTLKQITNVLNYEVQILVSSDLHSTDFIPGTENYGLSNQEKSKLGYDGNIVCDIHNHPEDNSSLPSPSDFLHGMQKGVVYLSMGVDGITERQKPKKVHINDSFYQYLVDQKQTPWREGDDYLQKLQEKALQELNTYPEFKDLTPDRQHLELDRKVDLFDFQNQDDYFNRGGRSVWEPYMQSFLDNQTPPWIKHLKWEQEQEINDLLRGKSTLVK